MKTYNHLVAFLGDQVWAITPSGMNTLNAVIDQRLRGVELTTEEKHAAIEVAQRSRASVSAPANVAVLPMQGPIFHRGNLFTEVSGGVSTQVFGRVFRDAMNDETISAVVLDVDSPGGSAAGIPELFADMMKSRGKKPVVAVANTMMASGALWLSAAADKIVASPSASVGSVGVRVQHVNQAEANEKQGVKITSVTSHGAPHKDEFTPDAELSGEDLERLQARADEIHADFEAALAKGRGISVKAVRNDFGGGRVLSAKEALSAGMVDEVATLEKVIADFSRGKGSKGARVDADPEDFRTSAEYRELLARRRRVS